ncbi:hybrid sensor histidine kinase/response regulator [Opitutus terrae]|uniref:histidine kinase n=1 Tax=Opitutus terrae (strain DSM 11246 / JCM 15787 / PB90-1) TaxID=452637 RepID=B1ZNI9_OPITP|nr:response regulator [Opitutus terrae]ACB74423.1 PAS/PAC sensor hybrid histidine kinase [Opitutus terrae PB90-1]
MASDPANSVALPERTPPVNILLVDDEPRNLDVLESLLHSAEYSLVRAQTAERALMLLLEGVFAVIVLDINMPGMSGIELAGLIKQRRRTQHIPIIFLTAYFQEDKDVLQGYGTGAVDYLTKPVNPEILRSKIAVFVELFRKTQALAASNAALEAEIRQRQQAEESLRQANDELEARVAARTAELVQLNQELQQRERALRASEAQVRFVTDYAPAFITQFDREHRFKFVNRTYARRFGLEPQQVIGQHFVEIMGEEADQIMRPHFEAALAGERVEFEAEIAYAGLGPRWVYVIHEPERAASGEIVGLLAVVTDITDRKLAEQEVARARDQALIAAKAKDDFLARLSHELRTPLNPVLLLASEAAGDPTLPPEVRADFESIAQNVTLEARLIDDLLDLTAITRGKLALALRPVRVHETLENALALVRQDLAQKNLRLVRQFDAPKDLVDGDDMRLKQIFWNVIKNAVKFTPPAGQITLCTRLSPDGGRMAITVTDTGIGMTAEECARIFTAFTQGDHALSGGGRYGGLGLGLAISRMLVQLHAGSISATSLGRDLGATFTIELPLSHAPMPVAPPAGSATPFARPGEPTPPPETRALRVLLIEDHQPTCRTLCELLTRRRYRVVTANTVADAYAAAARESFDFVISDVGLPDGNGCELMADLRARYGLRGAALTGYGRDEDVARSHAAGFVTHLTKPVSVRALDQALQQLVASLEPAN